MGTTWSDRYSAVGSHKGGFDPFTFDVTDFLQAGKNEIVVGVTDPRTFHGNDIGNGPKPKLFNIARDPGERGAELVFCIRRPISFVSKRLPFSVSALD